MEAKNKGKCPNCNSEDLDYDAVELEGESLFYPFVCNNCKANGQEWYNLKYISSVVSID